MVIAAVYLVDGLLAQPRGRNRNISNQPRIALEHAAKRIVAAPHVVEKRIQLGYEETIDPGRIRGLQQQLRSGVDLEIAVRADVNVSVNHHVTPPPSPDPPSRASRQCP